MTRSLLSLLLILATASLGRAQDGWPLFRANSQRTGAVGELPAWQEKPLWNRPLLGDKIEGFNEPLPDKAITDLLDRLRKDADPAILPAFYPLISGDLCIYRTHGDIRCVPLQKVGGDNGGAAGSIHWIGVAFLTSLTEWGDNPRLRTSFDRLFTTLARSNQGHWLWANPMTGAISTDGDLVYAIDDMPVPRLQPNEMAKLQELRTLVAQNSMSVYNLAHGKIVWDNHHEPADSPFKLSFFLGAPLPVKDRLYLLNEKANELRLMVMEPKKWTSGKPAPVEKTLVVLKLSDTERVPDSLLRRTQPLHLATVNDLLVCPTHAGLLIGVDRGKMESRWQYRYRAENVAPPPNPLWQAACPIIHKDRIVFTAADAAEIHCIDLDGKKKWASPQDKDLYLATVHDDLVLLIGKNHCRALALEDGKEKWKLELGLPAGVGVQDGNLYYVPIKKDGATGPSIWAIDLAKGKKAHRLQLPHGHALGNLALHRGVLVSQSVTHIAAFPVGVMK